MIKKYLILLCSIFLCVSSVKAQEYVDLHYHFKKGDEYQIHTKANQETYLTVNDIDQRTTNDKNIVILITFDKELSDGNLKLFMQYKHIILSSSQKDNKIYVDTDSDETDVFSRLFKGLTNKKFTVILSPQGKIAEVSGMDSIFDQMIQSLTEVKKEERSSLKGFLKEQMGPEQVKLNLSLLLPQYPPFKIHEGDSWTNHVETKGLYDGSIDNYWKMTYGNNFIAKLKNNAKFYSNLSQVVDLGGGQEGKVDLHGDVNSQYVINPKTSWPTRSIVHSELHGSFTFFVYKNKRQKRKNKKTELKVPVRIIKNLNYEIKHL